MTFYEAAVAVLREAGRPLHYKKIAEIAVREGLLSHVGKTPEITMGARLAQELRKPADETVLVSERPGIFSLRENVDPDEARETIRLHEASGSADDDEDDADDDDDDEATTSGDDSSIDDDEDDSDDEDNDEDDADDDDDDEGSSDDDSNGDEQGGRRRRRRRRGRRGGRGRREDETAGDNDSSGRDATPPGRPAEPEGPAQRRRAETPPRRGSGPAPSPREDGLRAAGDFARAVVTILREEKRDVLSLRQLSGALNRRGFGAAGKLSPAIVRRSLEDANQRRSRHGWPPLFVETRPDHWAIAAASGEALADSYAALERWQESHRAVLRDALCQRLQALDGAGLAAVVTLVLERLGHEDILQHERVGREHTTVSATLRHGLTLSRIAVRLAIPNAAVSREDVMAFRGSLHVYGADDGAIISLAGFEDDARSEAVVPNLASISLLDVRDLAEQLVDCGVGVSAFRVDVSCVDDAFFRDFESNGR